MFFSDIKNEITHILREQSLDEMAVKFRTNDFPLKMNFTEPDHPSTNITGGINLYSNGGYFSAGICGVYWKNVSEQVPVMITCGHGRSVGDIVYHYSGGTFKLIGTVIAKRFGGGQYYDYSIVEITNSQYTPTAQVYGNIMTTEATSHPVGAIIYKYGRNGLARGEIIYTNISVYYSVYNSTIYGLNKVEILSDYVGNCGGGDSGCPIYAGNTIYGLYSGDNRVIDENGNIVEHATTFNYSPIGGVLGFELN